MKTSGTTKLLLKIAMAFLLIFGSLHMQAQSFCHSQVFVSLNALGEAPITVDMVYNDEPGYTPISVFPDLATCDDLGLFTVVLTALDQNGDTVECISILTIEDKTPPVAICDQDVTVQLDPIGLLTLWPELIDDGSFDACSDVTFTITPQIIQCGDPNPLTVQLIVSDESGNTSSCITFVYYAPPVGGATLACNDLVTVEIVGNQPTLVTAEMILAGGPYSCFESYEVTLSLGGVDFPDDFVYPEHVGEPVLVEITDPTTGNSCWGNLNVVQVDCPLVVFCDTECNSTPVGDCNSGHTLDDHVEWPCDVVINQWMNIYNEYPNPEFLVANNFADTDDAMPILSTEACHQTSITYEDVVFTQSFGYTIERTWTIVEWHQQVAAEYLQIITIEGTPFFICDFLPWTAPVTDCAEGHTLTDAVEWPADDTSFTTLITPAQLAGNPDIHPNNVEPVITNTDVPSLVSYTDQVFVLNDTSAMINRTWSVYDLLSATAYVYEQSLYVFADLSVIHGCAFRENGDPVPDVHMIPAQTDETGCAELDVEPGDVITPFKSGLIQDGVDIIDLVLLMEHVLGISQLSPYQQLAADISGNGILSTLDVVYLQQIIDGEYTIDPVWRFYDASYTPNPPNPFEPPQSITVGSFNLAYNFVAVKMGDIDNSYDLGTSPSPAPLINLYAMDEILNNGESYDISMISDKTLAIQGLQLEIDASSSKVQYDAITSNVLPGFDMSQHVSFEGDKILVRYTVPLETMLTGDLRIDAGEPILQFKITATANGILSDELRLISNEEQYMKVSSISDRVRIILKWDDEIASRIRDLQLTGVSVYPNPTQDFVQILLDERLDGLTYAITDLGGRNLQSGVLTTTSDHRIDVSTIANGMYLITLQHQDGRRAAQKLVVQR